MELTIKQMHTKELIQALRSSYVKSYDSNEPIDMCDKLYVGQRASKNGFISFYATEKEIREELSLRPHIPNKKEGQAIRRLNSKGK